jgi:hypothetical protein
MVGHRPPLVLPGAHVVSLGVLLPPWTWPITLGGTILQVTKLLWPRSIVSWRGGKNCKLQYKTKPVEFHCCMKPVNHIFIMRTQEATGYPTICTYTMLMVITTRHHTPQNPFVLWLHSFWEWPITVNNDLNSGCLKLKISQQITNVA